VALGNPPHFLMRKDFHTRRQEATVMCKQFAHALRMHLRQLQTMIPSLSSDNDSSRESNDEEPSRLTSPPKFKISSEGKPRPKRGGVNCCRQRLGSRERTKDVHVLRRVEGLL